MREIRSWVTVRSVTATLETLAPKYCGRIDDLRHEQSIIILMLHKTQQANFRLPLPTDNFVALDR